MARTIMIAVSLATLLLGAACGPKDEGRATTPPHRPDTGEDPSPRPNDPDQRTTPPSKVAPRTPTTPRPNPSGVQCPSASARVLTAAIWPTAKAHLRRYISETRLDKVATTKATPVEVCSARGQIAWLLRARCPDGSAPFTDGRKAHRSRTGNVGPGGRCGKVVDLYKVPCPGATYSIFMSLYHCAAGQRFP